MSEKLTRYRPDIDYREYEEGEPEMVADPDGDYVYRDSVLAVLDEAIRGCSDSRTATRLENLKARI